MLGWFKRFRNHFFKPLHYLKEEPTRNNVVLKSTTHPKGVCLLRRDSQALARMHNLTLEETRQRYAKLLEQSLQ